MMQENNINNFNNMFPKLKFIPTEFAYGLVANKWFLQIFSDCIGLIGAGDKLDTIQQLLKHDSYQKYLEIEKFVDYIKIPQKFACDDLDNTEKIVGEQLVLSKSKIFLVGVGHVKSGLLHRLKKYKNAVYIDVGSGIDALAGMINKNRPYMKKWTNYILSNYDYTSIDYLHFTRSKHKKGEIYL